MRLIDADELYSRLMARYTAHNLDETRDMAARAAIMSCMEAVERSKTITATPPPSDQLTQEEPREMEGEPVWAMLRLPTNGIKGGWALVDTRHGYAAAQQRWTNWTLWYDEYGKTWTAYRRRPEEKP